MDAAARRAVRAQLLTMGIALPVSWSLSRDGQTRLEGLTIATKHWTSNHVIMDRWCPLLSSKRGKVQSQGWEFLGCSSEGQELL